MRYFKIIENECITSIGTGSGGTEITEQDYAEILSVIRNKPTGREGFNYRLKTDLTWEEYEKTDPEPVDDFADTTDYENALSDLGVQFND